MSTALMKKRRNPSEKGQAIAKLIMEQYQPKTQEDMQIALKDVFGPIFEAMLQGEMDNHLGYSSNDHSKKETSNRRNGYTEKTIQTSVGEVPIRVPRDRESTFEPQVVPKRTKDVTGIESKVLAMYARGMSQRDIAKTIDDIYGFELSAESISNITDRVMDEAQHWQTRPLKPFYPFLFVDCMYVSVRKDYETKNHGVSGLEEGAKSIFPQVVVQRCIVHLIRNSIKYIPSKDYKAYTTQLRKVYGAVNLKSAEAEFERFKQAWSRYPGAVETWKRNWQHVQQLFNYGSAVRKVMYTTNAIESVNSSFRKVTKKGSFSSEESVFKVLYLRVEELYAKWEGHHIQNWAMVRNQLAMDDKLQARILKYENF